MFGGVIEAVNHCRVLEGVHLEDDTSTLALVGKFYFTVDEAVQFGDEVETGDRVRKRLYRSFTISLRQVNRPQSA